MGDRLGTPGAVGFCFPARQEGLTVVKSASLARALLRENACLLLFACQVLSVFLCLVGLLWTIPGCSAIPG
jgi:hypothetical protein